jgi:single-stranded DNA-binding protein
MLTARRRVVVVGRLQQRAWTAEDGSAPIGGRGAGRGAGTEPSMGDGHDDQDGEEQRPVAARGSPAGSADGSGRGTFLVALDPLRSAAPAARRALVPEPGVGGAGPRLTRLAWGGHDPGRRAAPAGAAPSAPHPHDSGGGRPTCHPCRLPCTIGSPRPPAFHHKRDATPGEDARPEAAEKIHASTVDRHADGLCWSGQPADDGRGR